VCGGFQHHWDSAVAVPWPWIWLVVYGFGLRFAEHLMWIGGLTKQPFKIMMETLSKPSKHTQLAPLTLRHAQDSKARPVRLVSRVECCAAAGGPSTKGAKHGGIYCGSVTSAPGALVCVAVWFDTKGWRAQRVRLRAISHPAISRFCTFLACLYTHIHTIATGLSFDDRKDG